MDEQITRLLDQLDEAGVEYAVIGGHAVNAWLEPRFTADIDVTVHAPPATMDRLKAVLASHGYRVSSSLHDCPAGATIELTRTNGTGHAILEAGYALQTRRAPGTT